VKRLFTIFVLTPAEQRLVVLVVLLLVAGAWYKHHRDFGYNSAPQATPMATPVTSPTPNEQ
jgi:hypothetical protein